VDRLRQRAVSIDVRSSDPIVKGIAARAISY
jgi:hypothetical protein